MIEQQDIFSMFGIVDEVEEKKREEQKRKEAAEEIRKQSQQALKSTEKEGVENTFNINADTIIRFYGETINITTYFSVSEIAEGVLVKKKDGEERKKIDGEMIRKRMEKDFPELTKGMTEMVFLDKKNIVVPVMKAKKKGNCTETSSLRGDVFRSFDYRIPFSILRDFISVAMVFAEYGKGFEVHADIYLNPNSRKFYLDFPEQHVNIYWCEVIEEAYSIADRNGDAIKVMEIHSHHYMSPTPSSVDDEAERVPGMYYAIVGNFSKPFPDITIRQYRKSKWSSVSYQDVFENPFYPLPGDFFKIIKKVHLVEG